MADTEDVAKVLFEYLTNFPYGKYQHCYSDAEEMKDRLEELANVCRIGIEDARLLLWRSQHPME